jgi:glycosyltransferase involved in cell wall biosynthesis
MHSELSVSLVICTRNRAASLSECLAHVAHLESVKSFDVVVVDNGSTDHTHSVVAEFAAQQSATMRYLREERPGLARARNTGWRASAGSIVIFTDDDCYVSPSIIRDYLTVFSECAETACVGGRVMLHDPTDLRVTVQETPTRRDIPPFSFVPTGLIHGANFAFRRDALEALNGFDEMFGAGTPFPAEDVELIARVVASGRRALYDPRPTVRHHHGRKHLSEFNALQRSYTRGRGAYYAKCLMNPKIRGAVARGWLASFALPQWGRTVREVMYASEYLLARMRMRMKAPDASRDITA